MTRRGLKRALLRAYDEYGFALGVVIGLVIAAACIGLFFLLASPS